MLNRLTTPHLAQSGPRGETVWESGQIYPCNWKTTQDTRPEQERSQDYHRCLNLILCNYLLPFSKPLLYSELSVSSPLAELNARRLTALGNSEGRAFCFVHSDIPSNPHRTLYVEKIQCVCLEQMILVEINI